MQATEGKIGRKRGSPDDRTLSFRDTTHEQLLRIEVPVPGRGPRLPEGLPHRPGRAQLTHPVPRDMRLLKAQAYLYTPNEHSMTESFTRRRRTSFVPYTSPSHTQCAPAMLTRLSAALSPLPCWPTARSCLGRSPWLLTGSSRVELPCFQTLSLCYQKGCCWVVCSLPNWPCGFDSRHPLFCLWPCSRTPRFG